MVKMNETEAEVSSSFIKCRLITYFVTPSLTGKFPQCIKIKSMYPVSNTNLMLYICGCDDITSAKVKKARYLKRGTCPPRKCPYVNDCILLFFARVTTIK